VDSTHAFLVKFFDVFSQFKSNDFYVTGESYGGHYVPMIATAILDHGVLVNQTKGFLIGNPGINSDCAAAAARDHTHAHATQRTTSPRVCARAQGTTTSTSSLT
jgi:serine carboxypeptidase-like clade 2